MSTHASQYIKMENVQLTELASTTEGTSFNVDLTGLGPFKQVAVIVVVTNKSTPNFSLQPMVSADGTNYVADPDVTATSITDNGTFFTKVVNHGSIARLQFTRSGGSADFAVYTLRRAQ